MKIYRNNDKIPGWVFLVAALITLACMIGVAYREIWGNE
jgi:hypothetical protein